MAIGFKINAEILPCRCIKRKLRQIPSIEYSSDNFDRVACQGSPSSPFNLNHYNSFDERLRLIDSYKKNH